jgi:pimeloyl-ACP methyl ester carboxylesterase
MELRVNGTTLHGQSIGEGRPCLALHGGPGTDASGLARSLAPIAAELRLRLILYDHRGHGRSEWVPVEQCTQDQLVADVDGVREALGLGSVDVLGISWGGFLGLMYAARYPGAIRRLAVVGAAASRDFMARAEANARRRATAAQWAAYRALWDGSLADDASFRRAFETIRPLYFFDPTRAAENNAARRRPLSPGGAALRHRARVRALRLPRRAFAHRVPDPGRSRGPRLDLPGRPVRRDRAARAGRRAGRVRGLRPLAAHRAARRVHAAAGSLLVRAPVKGYFPVQRTLFSDW